MYFIECLTIEKSRPFSPKKVSTLFIIQIDKVDIERQLLEKKKHKSMLFIVNKPKMNKNLLIKKKAIFIFN